MLHWDAATMMPPGSAEDRHEQLAVLTTIRHDMLSSSETGELLAAALDTDALTDWQQANLREMEWRYTCHSRGDATCNSALQGIQYLRNTLAEGASRQ